MFNFIKTNKKTFLAVLIAIFSLTIIGLISFYFYKTRAKISSEVPVASNNQNLLTGGVIYKTNEGSVNKYDLVFGTSKTIYKVKENEYLKYQDGYIYSFDWKSGETRKIDSKGNVISNVKVDLPASYYIVEIHPSPDKNKLMLFLVQAVMGSSGLDNHSFLINFKTKKVDWNLKEAVIKKIEWFSDSRFVFLGRSVFDTETLQIMKIPDSDSPTGISSSGYGILQFPSKGEEFLFQGFAWKTDKRLPFLRYRTLPYYFPDIKDRNKMVADSTVPFFMFPIVGRDYKEVTKIISGEKENQFFVEIDSGKKEIYFTDSYGTFKKISLMDGSGYSLIGYLDKIKRVVAIRTETIGFNKWKYYLVLLDPGNYSEFNVDIPKKNFSVTILTEFSEFVPSLESTDVQLSPDGRYLLFPYEYLEGNKVRTKFMVTTVDGKLVKEILEDFGYSPARNDFYWVE